MRSAYAFKPTHAVSPELPRAPVRAQPLVAPHTPAQRLLDQLSADAELTGLSVGVLRVVRLLENGAGDLGALTDALLAEPFIAQKLIRRANVLTSHRGTGAVSTVSRALVVLGLNQVRAIATSTALLDQLEDRQ